MDPSIPEEQAYTFTITDEPFEEILCLMARINPIQYSFNEDNVVIITPKNKLSNSYAYDDRKNVLAIFARC